MLLLHLYHNIFVRFYDTFSKEASSKSVVNCVVFFLNPPKHLFKDLKITDDIIQYTYIPGKFKKNAKKKSFSHYIPFIC